VDPSLGCVINIYGRIARSPHGFILNRGLSVPNKRSFILLIEFLSLFAGAPLLILQLRDRWITVGLLWAGAVAALLYNRKFNYDGNPAGKPVRHNIKFILLRFAVIAPVITAVTWMAIPGWFLSFPRERPGLWLLVMILYPVLSVWPQEMIYRAFIISPVCSSLRHTVGIYSRLGSRLRIHAYNFC